MNPKILGAGRWAGNASPLPPTTRWSLHLSPCVRVGQHPKMSRPGSSIRAVSWFLGHRTTQPTRPGHCSPDQGHLRSHFSSSFRPGDPQNHRSAALGNSGAPHCPTPPHTQSPAPRSVGSCVQPDLGQRQWGSHKLEVRERHIWEDPSKWESTAQGTP